MGSVVNRADDFGASDAGAGTAAESIAWAELVPIVHRQMRALVGPSRDLEDLTQSALEQVLRGIARFEGRAELTTFTYRICAHVAMNHWRWWKRWIRRFDLGTERSPDPPYLGRAASDAALEKERLVRLHAALDRLTAPKRLVLVLSDLEELPASRVAEIVDCGEPTVRSRLRQARIDLARLLGEDPLFADERGPA